MLVHPVTPFSAIEFRGCPHPEPIRTGLFKWAICHCFLFLATVELRQNQKKFNKNRQQPSFRAYILDQLPCSPASLDVNQPVLCALTGNRVLPIVTANLSAKRLD
jgi:hypothetical protein